MLAGIEKVKLLQVNQPHLKERKFSPHFQQILFNLEGTLTGGLNTQGITDHLESLSQWPLKLE